MILLCGVPTERPLAMVLDQLRANDEDVIVLNQRRFADYSLRFRLDDAGLRGSLSAEGHKVDLADVRAVYLRPIGGRWLNPDGASGSAQPSRRAFLDALLRWTEVSDTCLVINRFSVQASNGSKPYQAQIIKGAGFAVPEFLITNEPSLVREFAARYGRIIYKSASGVRSIVTEMSEADWGRIDDIRWCPVQFQRLVTGIDVRVHVVGSDCFATAVDSDATDYRYARRQDQPSPRLVAVKLEASVHRRCVALAAELGLHFAGLDLRFADDGRIYCFEVNPSPGFSYYEAETGQPIAESVARLLGRRASDLVSAVGAR